MLRIDIGTTEYWDEQNEVFVTSEAEEVYEFEHSLYTVALWEAQYKKPFLNPHNDITDEELMGYILIMGYRQPIDINKLTAEHLQEILQYMNSEQTATTIQRGTETPTQKIITTEELYASMFELGIDVTCEHWHLSRFLTLVQVMAIRQGGGKKMNPRDVMAQNAALNAARRKALGTKG